MSPPDWDLTAGYAGGVLEDCTEDILEDSYGVMESLGSNFVLKVGGGGRGLQLSCCINSTSSLQ